MNFIFDQIKDVLSRAQNVIIISHQKPDGDACGSALAMAHYLKSFNKHVGVFCEGEAPRSINYLPGFEIITNDRNVFNNNWDVVLFLDCSDLPHSRVTTKELAGKYVINIDHHISNTRYGNINYVDARAGSASEIIHRFFTAVGFEIDRTISLCLMAGILTDTGTLTNGGTNVYAIDAVSGLTKKGANINIAFNHFFKNKSLKALKLWGEVLSRLKVNKEYGIAFTYICEEDYRIFSVNEEELDDIADFMNIVVDVRACLVLKFRNEEVKVSARTNKEGVDLSRLAQVFGGGGHKKASGFTITWPIAFDNGNLIIS